MASKRDILATVILTVYAIVMAGELDGRELRPSDHGLNYQESPPSGERSPPDMLSFFGPGGAGGKESTPAFPKSLNSNHTSSPWEDGNDANVRNKDHVQEALMVASLVCGITGVSVLLVSALLYIFRYLKHKSLPSSSSNDNPK